MQKCLVIMLSVLTLGCSEPPTAPGGADVTTSAAPPQPAVERPLPGMGSALSGARLWVNPDSRPARQASAWRTSRPADAAQMDRIAAQPDVTWLNGWHGDVRAAVAAQTSQIRGTGAVPVYVVYNIPARDCDLYSAGGAANGAAYRTFIRELVAGLGSARVAVILEPDALAGADCLPEAVRQERYALIAFAVETIGAQGSSVYIDAGHSSWHPAAVIAERLKAANIAAADGFALNVSNFMTTSSSIGFGETLSSLVGGRHFVIDTSRNGLGPTPDLAWCNPSGRALGRAPTTATGHPLVDAFLWIKKPGESDGSCNGAPAAGEWWPEYALGLARRTTDGMLYGG